MKNSLVIILMLAFGAFSGVPAGHAATIDLGGIKLRLPSVKKDTHRSKRRHTNRSTSRSSVSQHPRWQLVVQDGFQFATNYQGIWIGYDERGEMVMQLETLTPLETDPNKSVPVEVEINGRFYDTVAGTTANKDMVVVQGSDVERILGRLMSGRRVGMSVGQNWIETHLKGSSTAIRSVRSGASNQRRLFASGKVESKKTTASAEPGKIQYFQPGISGMGTAEVTFNIVEGTGLVLYVSFSEISEQADPAHRIDLNSAETTRAIELIRKAEKWTTIARENRVGLFSKRIGFVDDANGLPVSSPEVAETEEPSAEESNQIGVVEEQSTDTEATTSPEEPTQQEASEPAKDPVDFVAVNFNSYENGSTSAQLEHSVKGYSRRFNLPLEDALKLADSLEATLEHASFKLEKRDFDKDKTDKLFQ